MHGGSLPGRGYQSWRNFEAGCLFVAVAYVLRVEVGGKGDNGVAGPFKHVFPEFQSFFKDEITDHAIYLRGWNAAKVDSTEHPSNDLKIGKYLELARRIVKENKPLSRQEILDLVADRKPQPPSLPPPLQALPAPAPVAPAPVAPAPVAPRLLTARQPLIIGGDKNLFRYLIWAYFDNGLIKIGVTNDPPPHRIIQYTDDIRSEVRMYNIWDGGEGNDIAYALEQYILSSFETWRVKKPRTGRPTEYLESVHPRTVLAYIEAHCASYALRLIARGRPEMEIMAAE
jgi:hypothetical protein